MVGGVILVLSLWLAVEAVLRVANGRRLSARPSVEG